MKTIKEIEMTLAERYRKWKCSKWLKKIFSQWDGISKINVLWDIDQPCDVVQLVDEKESEILSINRSTYIGIAIRNYMCHSMPSTINGLCVAAYREFPDVGILRVQEVQYDSGKLCKPVIHQLRRTFYSDFDKVKFNDLQIFPRYSHLLLMYELTGAYGTDDAVLNIHASYELAGQSIASYAKFLQCANVNTDYD